jgi:hypothetical protein
MHYKLWDDPGADGGTLENVLEEGDFVLTVTRSSSTGG